MASTDSDPPPADTIVVGGSYDDDDSQGESIVDADVDADADADADAGADADADADADAESLDAYSEEDQSGGDQKSEPDDGNDDYTRIFDSPSQDEAQHGVQAQDATSHVSKALSESMNSSPAPNPVPAQTPVVFNSADHPLDPSHDAAKAVLDAPQPSSEQARPNEIDTAVPGSSQFPSPSDHVQRQTVDADNEIVGDDDLAGDDADDAAIDIEKLVEDITATAASPSARSASEPAEPAEPAAVPDSNSVPVPAPVAEYQSSLPPKPPLAPPQSVAPPQPHAGSTEASAPGAFHPNAPSVIASSARAPAPVHMPSEQPSATHVAVGAPGTLPDTVRSLPPPPVSSVFNVGAPAQAVPNSASYPPQNVEESNLNRDYESFLDDERRYVSEANWERFPDGSRIFIGNLSQERVSKRDVFELFHKYGRLAQISLKSAYGFVQYHTIADAQAAMQNLQGAEVRGRKIHLEYSRTQKKEKDQDRSPDRNKNRGGGSSGGGRGSDRYDGRDQGRRGRDDYRPGGRDASPRREDKRLRDDHYGRDRGHFDSFNRPRDRSRSPNRYGSTKNSNNPKPYRSRRSPSPRRRSRSEGSGLDSVPRRYGTDVPDVQFLLTQGLEPDFIQWVQRAFSDRGLKTDVMYLNPRSIPRETVIQRQVLEGVHAVSDLDFRAQNSGKISLHVFDRSGGTSVRFDVYQDLAPTVAADVVIRAKATSTSQPNYQPVSGYGQQYYPPAAQGLPGYPNLHAPAGVPAPAVYPAASNPSLDLASLISQVDSSTLSQLLATLQGSQHNGQIAGAAPAAGSPMSFHQPYQPVQPAAASPSQLDLNALLSTLKNAAGGAATGAPGMVPYGGTPYQPNDRGVLPAQPSAGPAVPGAAGDGTDQTVQSIMAQLAKYRQ